MGKKHIKGQIKFIRRLIFPVVQKHYPSKANREKMKLYDLITFAIMAHLRFGGVYKKAYRVLIEELHLFPKVKYNKILERLSRYENLLAECKVCKTSKSWELLADKRARGYRIQ
jgi:hypothetical protein